MSAWEECRKFSYYKCKTDQTFRAQSSETQHKPFTPCIEDLLQTSPFGICVLSVDIKRREWKRGEEIRGKWREKRSKKGKEKKKGKGKGRRRKEMGERGEVRKRKERKDE